MSSQLPLPLSPLSLPQDDRATQDHSTEGQPCQAQSSGLHSFGFPLRVIPLGCEKHPGPRPPLEAYLEAQRWIKWQPDSYVAGIWDYEWLKHPTIDDVSLLVEEMVLHGILPECFSAYDGDQEAATARIDPFNSGANNKLYTLRCRCRSTRRGEQAVVAGSLPQDLSQSSSDIESQRPLNSNIPLTPSDCRSTLLHHDGGCDRQDSCSGSHIPGEVLLRLSLSLDPYFHTESEVATAHFARVRGVPVPRIYAYDSSAVNCLGIEWQLVEEIPEPDANFVSKIMTEESNVPWARGSPPPGVNTGPSAAWTRLGHQLEETLAFLRSEGRHSHRGQSSGACFDKIGSLYWDYEKHDFVLGPVSNHYFIRGRRILYYQGHDRDGGDPRFPLLRGPFGSVSEFLNAMLTVWIRESGDEALRVDDDQPYPPTSPASSEANDNTATTTATPYSVTDADDSSEYEEPSQPWYTKAHAEMVHDQVSKLRDIIIPWLVAKLTPGQQERMRTYISHPDLSCSNLLVSRRAQTQMDGDGDGDGDRINVLGEEYAISAILDWEHTVALPDYLIRPVKVAPYFCDALPTAECPDYHYASHAERCLGDAADSGRAARSPWTATLEVPAESVPEDLIPWRSDDDSRDGPAAAAEGEGGGGSGGSNVDGVRGADSDMQQRRDATTRSLMTPPRRLTNAEVVLRVVFERLDVPGGNPSENWVNPLAEVIQAHIANERQE